MIDIIGVKVKQPRSASEKRSDRCWDSIAILISAINIILGVVALFLCYFPIADYHHLWSLLDAVGLSDNALFWGLVYIPSIASLTIFNGIYEIIRTCQKTTHFKFDLVKFFTLFGGEVMGFGLPYGIIQDYTKKIDVVLMYSRDGQYIIFNLLLVNGVTTGLVIYQICTFGLVFYQNFTKKEKDEKLPQTSSEGKTDNGKDKKNEDPVVAGMIQEALSLSPAV